MPNDTIPPIPGLEPLPDRPEEDAERALYDHTSAFVAALLQSIMDAMADGSIPQARALALIQGTSETGRELAKLFHLEDDGFEEGIQGRLRRRTGGPFGGFGRIGGGAQDELLATLRRLVDAQVANLERKAEGEVPPAPPVIPAGTPQTVDTSTPTEETET